MEYLDPGKPSPYSQSSFVLKEEFMNRKAKKVKAVLHPSRREFLVAGGTVVTTLTLGRAQATTTPIVSEERERIRAIMKRYGSELGNARYIEKG
jgi:hypothetical protein